MTAICAQPAGANAIRISDRTAIVARGRSGVRLWAIHKTACATMAAATSLRPWISPSPAGPLSAPLAVGDKGHRDRRRQREARPGGDAAEIAGAHEPDREPGLAAGRSGQELAKRDEIGVGGFVEPGAVDDELAAEVAEMRDRPAEAGQAELEKNAKDFRGRTSLASLGLAARSQRPPAKPGGHRAAPKVAIPPLSP